MRPLAVLLALVFAGSAPEAAASGCEGGEAAVRGRAEALASAFARADAAALEAMIAPGYVHTNGGSGKRIDRERWLRWIGTRRAELDRGTLRVTRYENSDVAVHVFGEAAVVTGMNVTEGTRDGAPFSTHLRFTQVWICQDGTWLRAAFHDSAVPALPEETRTARPTR